MPAVGVNLQLVWGIEMTQPLRRVERIMLAMNLDDAQACHSRDQIRQAKGSFACGLDAHQIGRRAAIWSPLGRRDDEKTDQLRLAWNGCGSGRRLFGSRGVAGKNDWNVANPIDATCLVEGSRKSRSEDFLIIGSRIGEFPAVPTDHTQSLQAR